MYISQLRNALTVAQYRSLSLAAEKLYLSKQTLSESLSRLENEFDIQIFERSRRGMEVTSIGEEFLQDVQALAILYEQMIEKYTIKNRDVTDTLTMVAYCHLSHLLLPKMVKYLHRKQPSLKVDITDVSCFEDVFSFLEQMPDAIALVTIHIEDQLLLAQHAPKTFHLLTDNACVVGDESFFLCQQSKIQISDLLDYPIVDNNKYAMAAKIREFFPDIPLNIELTTGSIETYRQVIKEKLAIGFSTEYLTDLLRSPYDASIKVIPLSDRKQFQMQIALLCARGKTDCADVLRLKRLLKSQCL